VSVHSILSGYQKRKCTVDIQQIINCDLMSSLFHTFLIYYDFLETFIMTDEPTHTASKQRNKTTYPSYINYHLKSELPKMFHCQPCSTCYTAVWINNCMKRTSANIVSLQTITYDFHCEWKPSHAFHKIDTFHCKEIWMGH